MPQHYRAILAASGAQTREEVAFLQRRVASFGWIGTVLGVLGFSVAALLGSLPGSRQYTYPHPTTQLFLLASLCLLAVWLVCRRGSLSRKLVHRIEEAGLLGSCGLYVAAGVFLPAGVSPEQVVASTLTLMVMARSVYVPSTAARTFVLASIVGVLFVAVATVFYAEPEVLRWADRSVLTSAQATLVQALVNGADWTFTVILATATSAVIYGLRREVGEARQLGQYILEEKLGEGGMGVVYRARHAMLRRPTAVKLLLPDRISEEDLRRFEREVQITATLTHPNTVTVFDYGRTLEGVFYYAMELLDGASLTALVRYAGPLPAGRVVHVMHAVASALTEAHGIGLIHRDIKPANVIVCRRGGVDDVPMLLDFGAAKSLRLSDPALTHADEIIGTPEYLAPEMALGSSPDARADLYALGAVGYFLLTGSTVFAGRTALEMISHHLRTEPEPPSRRLGRDVPEDLERLILECLCKDPARRPQSADDLRARLECLTCFGAWSRALAREWWQHEGDGLRTVQRAHATGWASVLDGQLREKA